MPHAASPYSACATVHYFEFKFRLAPNGGGIVSKMGCTWDGVDAETVVTGVCSRLSGGGGGGGGGSETGLFSDLQFAARVEASARPRVKHDRALSRGVRFGGRDGGLGGKLPLLLGTAARMDQLRAGGRASSSSRRGAGAAKRGRMSLSHTVVLEAAGGVEKVPSVRPPKSGPSRPPPPTPPHHSTTYDPRVRRRPTCTGGQRCSARSSAASSTSLPPPPAAPAAAPRPLPPPPRHRS